jgi:transcriptional regulator with XRE-family HTH domain
VARLRQILAKRVRQICDEKDMPFTHLADRAGIGRATMARLVAAERSTGIDMVEQVSKALDVDPLELLRDAGKDPPPRKPGRRPRRRRTRP